MTTNAAPPGWHPDPSNPGGALRWWDGIAWTHHTQQPAAVRAAVPTEQQSGACAAPAAWPNAGSATAGGYPTGGYPTSGYPTGGYPTGTHGQAQQLSYVKQNSLSFTVMGVVAVYILLAMSTHIVVLGILPVVLSVRAVRQREALAPVAVIAAIVAVLVAFAALS
jgi:uncharacterized membrane protein